MSGSVYKIIMAVTFALLIFMLVYIIVYLINAEKIAAERRLKVLNEREGDLNELVLVKNESKSTKRRKENKLQKTEKGEKIGMAIYKQLQTADIKMRPEEFITMWLLLTFVPGPLVALFLGKATIALILMAAGAAGPILYIKRKQKGRIKKFEEQLCDALMICCSCLRSGLSFNQSMETIATDMEAPISVEFETVIRELSMGYSMDEAMENLGRRMKSKYVDLMVSAVLVQRQTGGNLSYILENISNTIIEKMKLKKQFKTSIASGRASGLIVGAMPVIMLGLFTLVSYDHVSVLYKETRGHMLLLAIAGLEGIAFLVIKRMTTLKI